MAGRRRSQQRSAGTGRRSSGEQASVGPDTVPDSDPEAVARALVLRRLTQGPRTRAQLEDLLRRRGIPDPTVDRVLDRYTEVGLVDDEAFADAWVESRHAGRGLARRALAYELRQRGVAADTVDAAVDALPPEQEVATARALVRSRLRATRGSDPDARVRRAAGVLARKGYGAGLTYRLIREELEAEGLQHALQEPTLEEPMLEEPTLEDPTLEDPTGVDGPNVPVEH